MKISLDKKRHVIHPRNWKLKPPIMPGIVLWLFLDRLHAPQWLYGVIAPLLFLWLVIWMIEVSNSEEVDVIQEINDLKKK